MLPTDERDIATEHEDLTVSSASAGRVQDPSEELERGDELGRYVILDRLGAGGMGVVYAAYDSVLDRKVALKLVRFPRASAGGTGPIRLQREAMAMAKLSHPNVITVHDVGVVEGRVFIAMEFVDGETLTDYLRRDRTWQEVVDVFVRAGTGLYAAHQANLVHRDFKPDNVLLGKDGRVRVMDFGIARAEEEQGNAEPAPRDRHEPTAANSGGGDGDGDGDAEIDGETDTQISQVGGAMASTLTALGTVMGTPAYMAPEQHLGLRADARADQFAFCVALFEGLYGRRPFTASNRHALTLAVIEGKLEPPPKSSAVPGWLRAIVLRGLSSDPEQRFASMHELLEGIAEGREPARPRLGFGAALGLGIGVVAIAFALNLALDKPGEQAGPCEDTTRHIDEAWGPSQRGDVERAFVGAGLGEGGLKTVLASLDGYASEWTQMRQSNCEATRVEGTQSDHLMDLRTACLDRRRTQLSALVELLASGNAGALAEASKSIENLTPVSACADEEQLRMRVPLPEDPAAREAVEQGERVLAAAQAHQDAGHYAEALARLDTLDPSGAALGHAPLAAALGQLRGRILTARGQYSAAEQALLSAALDAARGRDDRLLVEVYIELIAVVGMHLGHSDEAARLEHMAEVVLARVGETPDLDRRLRIAIANNRRVSGKPDVALQIFEQLRAELNEASEGETVLASELDRRIAALLANLGRYEQAEQLLNGSIAALERQVGAEHPALVVPLTNLGNMYARRGDIERARGTHDRVLALAERYLGPEHPDTAVAYESVAVALYHTGNMVDARVYVERAVASYANSYDAGHPALVRARGNLSAMLIELGEFEAAEPVLVESRDALVARFGREHDYLAFLLNNLATLYTQLGRYDEALEAVVWGLSVAESTFGPGSERAAECHVIKGTVHASAGELELAQASFEHALAIYATIEAPLAMVADAEYALADIFVQVPGRRVEGERLFASAYARALAAGDTGAPVVAKIEKTAGERGITLAPAPVPD